MAITDELMAWWLCKLPIMDSELHKEFTAIVKRIDSENERAMAAAALIAGVPMTDESMAEHGLVKLPKDADGVMWNIGDRTESGQTVRAFGLNEHGWYFIGTVNEIDPSLHRHYKQPTVEDVLREFALACEDAGNAGPEVARIAAEYAAKLRLVGEGE